MTVTITALTYDKARLGVKEAVISNSPAQTQKPSQISGKARDTW